MKRHHSVCCLLQVHIDDLPGESAVRLGWSQFMGESTIIICNAEHVRTYVHTLTHMVCMGKLLSRLGYQVIKQLLLELHANNDFFKAMLFSVVKLIFMV